jgi:cbb3-type cytochrome oxidase maturation protein
MSVIYILLPLAVVFAFAFVGAFVWSLRRGQFDDLDAPPLRALFGDELASRDAKPRRHPECEDPR